MRSILLALLILTAIPMTGNAQTSVPEDPSKWFDFWVGDWNLTWQTNGTTEKGTNKIQKTLAGKVIEENFAATEGSLKGYIGRSWSVYDLTTKTWKQTWVDNQGGYLDFIGGRNGDRFYFQRSSTNPQTDVTTLERMTFYDIKADSFMWDWEKSTDNGKSWQLSWRINYQRAK